MANYKGYSQLFLLSLSFLMAILSLATHNWILIENPVNTGEVRFGLIQKCDRVHKREEFCSLLDDRPPEWWITALLIGFSAFFQFVTFVLTLPRVFTRRMNINSGSCITRLCVVLSALSLILVSVSVVLFPAGFYMDAIGGEKFKLPDNVSFGWTYWVFYVSALLTIAHFITVVYSDC